MKKGFFKRTKKMVHLKEIETMFYLKLIHTTTRSNIYHEYTWLDLWIVFLSATFLIIAIWFVKYLFSKLTKRNDSISFQEIEISSPFLIKEHSNGELYFQKKKKNRTMQVVAVMLIIFILARGLDFVLDPLGPIFYW